MVLDISSRGASPWHHVIPICICLLFQVRIQVLMQSLVVCFGHSGQRLLSITAHEFGF